MQAKVMRYLIGALNGADGVSMVEQYNPSVPPARSYTLVRVTMEDGDVVQLTMSWDRGYAFGRATTVEEVGWRKGIEGRIARIIVDALAGSDGVLTVERYTVGCGDPPDDWMRVTMQNRKALGLTIHWPQDQDDIYAFDYGLPSTPRVSQALRRRLEHSSRGHSES